MEKEREEGNGRQKQNKTNREPPKAGRRLPRRREGHVLLNEDLHQVDVAAGGRCMQGCPQLIVLGIHVGTMGKEQLDNLLKVVDAALRGAKGDRGRVSSCRAGRPQEGQRSQTESESSCMTYTLRDLEQAA